MFAFRCSGHLSFSAHSGESNQFTSASYLLEISIFLYPSAATLFEIFYQQWRQDLMGNGFQIPVHMKWMRRKFDYSD